MILTQLQWHLYVYPYCFRLWLAKYFSMMVVVMLSVYYAVPTRRRYDPNSTAVAFVHLMSFAMHFGAQCWVTFIAGLAHNSI